MSTTLESKIFNISEYTKDHPELLNAHHFTYDLKIKDDQNSNRNYMVIGLNPGELGSWETCDGPTEETSLYDFFVENGFNKNRSATNWSENAQYFLGDQGNIITTNFFFWSAPNTNKIVFTERFGYEYHKNPHFDYCKEMNLSLFEYHKPKLIVAPGISMSRMMARKYNLGSIVDQSVNYNPINFKTSRLIEHYEYQGIPFIFTKHWTGRWGADANEKRQIKEYLHKYL